MLHTTATIGAAATRAALFGAANAGVLHIAAHAESGLDGAALVLADGAVPVLEVAARQIGPALVVLPMCDAGTSSEYDSASGFDVTGRPAAGFLTAGSQRVVTTLHSVPDADAKEAVMHFYRAGVADPARALWAAQVELSQDDNDAWPYFAVFGPEVCPAGASAH
jgi:CHAT domain-containing protein